jgi:exopolysaccharide biosynthesis polyprenyl glycosylphosphotransferase
MKKSEILFSAILAPIDYLLIVAAGVSAYFLRYSDIYQENVREVVFSLSFAVYLKYALVLAVVWVIIFALSGLFSMRPNKKMFDILNKIFLACSTGTLAVIVIFFFSRELFSSRFIILAVWILSIIYTSLAHVILRFIQQALYKKGVGIHRVVLIGEAPESLSLSEEIHRQVNLGYKIIFHAKNYSEELREKIKELAEAESIDEIIQANPNLGREESLALMDVAEEYHLDFKYVADILGAQRTNVDIKMIDGVPLIEIKKTPLDGWGRVAKRIFDIIGALIALIICVPIFIVLAVVIKIDSKGPIIYRTERIGAKGKRFYLYKFRSMIMGAEKMKEELLVNNERADGPLFKMKDDPRITKVGKVIRRISFDELPNFWNVLIGNMSLVGPRPHEPREVDRYEKRHKKLLNIKPGITGMAQVSGRSTLDFEAEVRLDTLYIEQWSLKLDLIILVKTPVVVLWGRTAA